MPEFIWILIIVLCMIIGIVGSVLPALPGPPIAFAGMLLYKFSPFGENFNWWWIIISGLITLIALIGEYYIPVYTTKKYGGSKYGTIGAALGILVGLFLPLGFIYGPFTGALIGELIHDITNHRKAIKASWGAFLGFLLGIIINASVCCMIITILIFHSLLS